MDIVFEDNHILIINKKAGQLSQSDKTGDISILDLCKSYIKKKYNKNGNVFLGLVNRIDRPTSGLLILAKTSKCLERMNKILRLREIKKTYFAIIEKGSIDNSGKLVDYLKKNEKKNKSFIVNKKIKGSKKSILTYELIRKLNNYYVIKINIETGRHHQIRAQLSNINCSIKGDVKYGAKRANNDFSICLHSSILEFTHPTTKKELKIEAKFPDSKIWNSF